MDPAEGPMTSLLMHVADPILSSGLFVVTPRGVKLCRALRNCAHLLGYSPAGRSFKKDVSGCDA